MATKKTAEAFSLAESLLNAYATNNRINLYLIQHLPDEAWTLKAPGGKGRDAASMIAHIHNVRLMWMKSAGVDPDAIPAKLDGADCTKETASVALEESWRAMGEVLRKAIESDGRIKGFKPDVASFIAYLLAHDAHHRGQISMVARQAGFALSQSAIFGMWEWGTR